MMSMGKGAIVNIDRKHKINMGSSTESELVSISDVLGMIMWCKFFMEAQGYTIEINVLYRLVGRWIIWSTLGLQGAHRCYDVNGKGRHCQHCEKSQDERGRLH